MGPFLKALYKVYLDYDCSLAEINPLVLTGDGKLIAAIMSGGCLQASGVEKIR